MNQRNKDVLFVTAIVLVPVMISVTLWRCHAQLVKLDRDARESRAKRSVDELNQQLHAVRTGESTFIWLYDTGETDRLLREIHEDVDVRDRIKTLWLGMTDVTDAGMHWLKEFRSLESLTIEGGAPGVSDIGLSALAFLPRLRELGLVNTSVTPTGLSRLRDVSTLRDLRLVSDTYNKPLARGGFSEIDVVQSVGTLRQLESLHLGGEWYSTRIVDGLQRLLPDLTINAESEHDCPGDANPLAPEIPEQSHHKSLPEQDFR